jgi:holo-[acyl-carrier protein] synthase
VIRGLGIDVVEIDRVRRILSRHGEAFLDRILAPNEERTRALGAEGPAHVAGVFAAKEAVMKALGTGMVGAAFREIAVVRAPSGQPGVALSGRALAASLRLGVEAWYLSITHARSVAAAVALAIGHDTKAGGRPEAPPADAAASERR